MVDNVDGSIFDIFVPQHDISTVEKHNANFRGKFILLFSSIEWYLNMILIHHDHNNLKMDDFMYNTNKKIKKLKNMCDVLKIDCGKKRYGFLLTEKLKEMAQIRNSMAHGFTSPTMFYENARDDSNDIIVIIIKNKKTYKKIYNKEKQKKFITDLKHLNKIMMDLATSVKDHEHDEHN